MLFHCLLMWTHCYPSSNPLLRTPPNKNEQVGTITENKRCRPVISPCSLVWCGCCTRFWCRFVTILTICYWCPLTGSPMVVTYLSATISKSRTQKESSPCCYLCITPLRCMGEWKYISIIGNNSNNLLLVSFNRVSNGCHFILHEFRMRLTQDWTRGSAMRNQCNNNTIQNPASVIVIMLRHYPSRAVASLVIIMSCTRWNHWRR
jgi:hypothetical protein